MRRAATVREARRSGRGGEGHQGALVEAVHPKTLRQEGRCLSLPANTSLQYSVVSSHFAEGGKNWAL